MPDRLLLAQTRYSPQTYEGVLRELSLAVGDSPHAD